MNIKLILRRYNDIAASQIRLSAYAREFAKQGHNVTLYYVITHDRKSPNIDIPKVKVECLWKSDGILASRCKYLSYIKNLLRIPFNIDKGDVVMMYGKQLPFMLILLTLKRKANIFCEITEHPFCENDNILTKINAKIVNWCLRQFDGLFVISQSLKQYFVQNGIADNAIRLINMFVETNRFDNTTQESTEKYIAYCGKISVRKDGVDDLINAFALFHKKHLDYKLRLIGGFQNDRVKESLNELIHNLDLCDSIEFTGRILPSEMPRLLKNASILALARPDNIQSQNGFPTKLGEYLATGNPVVVTAVGEIPNFLKDKENAFIVLPNNPKSFAEGLSQVADNYDYALLVGAKGKLLCNEVFSSTTQAMLALQHFTDRIRIQ